MKRSFYQAAVAISMPWNLILIGGIGSPQVLIRSPKCHMTTQSQFGLLQQVRACYEKAAAEIMMLLFFLSVLHCQHI